MRGLELLPANVRKESIDKLTKLTSRFDEALIYATDLHRHQVRKGTDTPYISHLMSVAALVLEEGGNEDQAIAALLHDVPDVRVNLNSNAPDRITTSNCRPTLPGADVTGQPTRVIFNGAPVTQRAWLNDVLTNIAPSMIQAIEIYNGSITVPPRFQPACGVIAIWTRKQ